MTNQALQLADYSAPESDAVAALERAALVGDLSQLSPSERLDYYRGVCRSLGLNPLTRPFDYLRLNGKMVLYAKRECTDQLRALHGVSITRLDHSTVDGITITTAYARDKNGREDADIGAVTTKGLQGDALANARMKAITKAKRRVTLAICGLGWLDETEVETIPNAQPVVVTDAGEIVEPVQGEVVSLAESLGRKILDRARKSAETMSAEPASDKVTNNIAGLLFEVLGDEQDVDLLIRAIFGNGIKGLRADQAAFIAQWANHEHFKKQANAALVVAKTELAAN